MKKILALSFVCILGYGCRLSDSRENIMLPATSQWTRVDNSSSRNFATFIIDLGNECLVYVDGQGSGGITYIPRPCKEIFPKYYQRPAEQQ